MQDLTPRDPRFLVTGAYGCIGAWVVAELVADGRPVVTFDLSTEPRRLRLLLEHVGHPARAAADRLISKLDLARVISRSLHGPSTSWSQCRGAEGDRLSPLSG